MVDSNEHSKENEIQIQLQREGLVETVKLFHGTAKLMTTLTAGSVVLIGTLYVEDF